MRDVAFGKISTEDLPELLPDVKPKIGLREMELLEGCKSQKDADVLYGFMVFLEAVGPLKDYKAEEDR